MQQPLVRTQNCLLGRLCRCKSVPSLPRYLIQGNLQIVRTNEWSLHGK